MPNERNISAAGGFAESSTDVDVAEHVQVVTGASSEPLSPSDAVSPHTSDEITAHEPKPMGCAVVTSSVLYSFAETTGLTDVRRLFPVLVWAPQYTKNQLIGDIVAGLTVGLMVIPQGMAYANLAGLPPAFGLYSAFMGCFVYTMLGTAKDVTLGPTALMSLIVSEAFTELDEPDGFENKCSDIKDPNFCCDDGGELLCTPVNLAVAATLVSGCYQILFGFLNFGSVVDYIGFPVLNGFTTAAAVTIFTSQIRHILGLTNVDRHWMFTVRDLFAKIDGFRWADFVMGIACIIMTYYLEGLKRRYNDRRNLSAKDYAIWLCGTARNAIVVIFGLVVARIVGATSAGDDVFRLVYEVPQGLPDPENPLKDLSGDDVSSVLTASLAISLLGYLESIAIGKAFAQKNGYVLDPTQEMRAIGVGNVVSSFFSSYAITGSFSRTAVNAASNVQTPLGGVFTGLLVIISLEAFTSAFFWIPKAALAAIIMMSVIHMVDIGQVRRIAKINPQDLIVWMSSFLACLLWSLEFGILLAIGVSIIIQLFNSSNQKLLRLKRDMDIGIWVENRHYQIHGLPTKWGPMFVENVEGPLVLKVTGFLDFAMTNSFRDRMATIARYYQSEDTVRAVIIDMSAIARVDYTGILALEYVMDTLKPGRRKVRQLKESVKGKETAKSSDYEIVSKNFMGIRIHITNVSRAVVPALKKAGLLDGNLRLGDWNLTLHRSIDTAIDSLTDDFAQVEAKFPFDWKTPMEKAVLTEEGKVLVGRDDTQWVCTKKGACGRQIWARSAEVVQFKATAL